MGKAPLLEQRPDIALVIVDAETFVDDALEIDAPPSHDAVDLPSGPASTMAASSFLWLATGVDLVRSPRRHAVLPGRLC